MVTNHVTVHNENEALEALRAIDLLKVRPGFDLQLWRNRYATILQAYHDTCASIRKSMTDVTARDVQYEHAVVMMNTQIIDVVKGMGRSD